MPPIPKHTKTSARITRALMKSRSENPLEGLTFEEKAYAALSMMPTWNSTLAYKAMFPSKNLTDDKYKKAAYEKNKKGGIFEYKTALAELMTGLKADQSVFPKKTKRRVAYGDEVDSYAEESDKPHRDLDSIIADSDKYTKEAILLELSQMAKETSDTGEKIKIFNAISALENMKSVASVDEENVVRYFLPLRCKSACSLYAQAVKDGIVDADD